MSKQKDRQMDRFKKTDLGKFLNDKFPGIAEEIIDQTRQLNPPNSTALPELQLIKSVWNAVGGISFEDRMRFEELAMFYSSSTCPTKDMLENKKLPMASTAEILAKGVLYLLAVIGFIGFITKVFF